MTKHIAPLPYPDGSLLLREFNHRVNNELTNAICTISAKAVRSDDAAVKAALLDVVDLLHGCADVHKALRTPDPGNLTDAARYLQRLCFSITKYRLDRQRIRLVCSADDLRLEGERCWKLGLIVSELLNNVARHARFDDRHPEVKVKLLLAGDVVRCAVSDNGSAPDLTVRGRGLTIVGGLASSLGGRVHASCAAEGASILLTFPLTESEQHAARAAHVVFKRRKVRRSRRFQVARAEDAGIDL
ncbi:ATP-binding protein [Bradyrhizobium australafricanum]|uniref:ATP-binding protein n=1 Tax=Bradyrhizobium australafricanum TaxID=2821406 RepID=UPI001CE3A090|nr:sensor histidine kinase [Bradyrhizobium australafricanum]MCA6104216.1 sensor histidine kinase [Bradyrhizobium australafricanum]